MSGLAEHRRRYGRALPCLAMAFLMVHAYMASNLEAWVPSAGSPSPHADRLQERHSSWPGSDSEVVQKPGARTKTGAVLPSRSDLARGVGVAAVLQLLGGSTPAYALRREDAEQRIRLLQEILEEVDKMTNEAANAPTVEEEERAWTKMLDRFKDYPEIEVGALSNRGNSRARQGKLEEALADYDRAVGLGPDAPDAHLNRGAVYENLGRLEEALADYDFVLQSYPNDPAAWNNKGNALLGLKRYKEAKEALQQALIISPSQNFAFAAVNLALAQFALGEDDVAIQGFRKLLERWAEAFPDARAAYALILWDKGDPVEAQSQWARALAADPRYGEKDWVTKFRRWPQRLMDILDRFAAATDLKVKK
eukprot:TRINITY_DN28031_c0_g1_i1.p1 TRINITY_DN28031_c0_g1~~TRINITY_DN28031_c0_g1_i1.p1  ORF type:complete len:366 (-),score=69.53 TRINITY_DN28031_c0_g1_i1:458-1555(-)